jgi:hypothetical protein
MEVAMEAVMIPTIFGGIFLLFVVVLGLAAFVFWIWMLVDCIQSNLPSTKKPFGCW